MLKFSIAVLNKMLKFSIILRWVWCWNSASRCWKKKYGAEIQHRGAGKKKLNAEIQHSIVIAVLKKKLNKMLKFSRQLQFTNATTCHSLNRNCYIFNCFIFWLHIFNNHSHLNCQVENSASSQLTPTVSVNHNFIIIQ